MGAWRGDRTNDPTFSRLVLDHAPTPILVVDLGGSIVFANRAACELGGRPVDALVGSNILDFVHDDDREWVAELYAEITAASDAAHLEDETVWAPVHVRFVDPAGEVVPVRVTAHGGFSDPAVEGIIFDLHEAHIDEILGRVLRGITAGVPVTDLLAMVNQMIVAPPLGLEAAILESDDSGRLRVIASSSETLAGALDVDGVTPWTQPLAEPVHVSVERLPAPVADRFAEAGFLDLWHVAVESALGASTYRIVVASPIARERTNGVVDLIRRATELAGVVLVRSQSDDMLRHAALHDPLTRLPNRTGFTEGLGDLRGTTQDVAVLYIDLDGFKAINDRHGHAAGDRVLEVIADRLRSATRPSDLVARVGGDEFVVVLAPDPSRPPAEQGVRTAERIVQLVGESIDLGRDTLVGVAASVGVAVAEGSLEFDDLLADADAAMYVAKRAGGNRYSTIG